MPKAILKSNEEIALSLYMRPARTEAGRKVQERVLVRVEIAIWIADALR